MAVAIAPSARLVSRTRIELIEIRNGTAIERDVGRVATTRARSRPTIAPWAIEWRLNWPLLQTSRVDGDVVGDTIGHPRNRPH